MSDAESRHEDAKRERWEARHADEFDQPCPDCQRLTFTLVDFTGQTHINPRSERWRCRACGFVAE